MIILSHHIPISEEIRFVAKETNQSCEETFLDAVFLVSKNSSFDDDDKVNLGSFARTACQTKNPDIIWQIAYVESKFAMNVVGIPGSESLYGEKAVQFIKGIGPHQNVDIGPMQINWRVHGSHSGYPAHYFLNGTFSLNYLSKFVLGPIVKGCKVNWIDCYNSWNSSIGSKYRVKVDQADLELRRILAEILKK
jgi:hypothetical protein